MSEGLQNQPVRIYCRGAALTPAFWSALGAALDVEFVAGDAVPSGRSHPMIWIGDCSEAELAECNADRVFIAPVQEPAEGLEIREVEIRECLPGKPWMKGKRLTLADAQRIDPLRSEGGVVMMATEAGAVWLREVKGSRVVDRVALALPVPGEGQAVFEWFNAVSFARWLPLVQFVREVGREHEWQSTIKACFMFDDPNLRATRYGYIDYAATATEARHHGYHVSFATIPFDGWYVSNRAAALFRDHPQQLSLLIHGNNHVFRELAQEYSPEQRRALLAQALRRIQQVEKRANVKVCRVMAAPHGACSEAMLGEMARFGFAAASISHGSLKRYNGDCPWTRSLGSRPAEFIAGLPVFPRFMMAKEVFQASLFAAYLGQPIIPMGHHEDVAGGLEALQRMAAQIQQLGEVRWMSMTEVCETHFQWRLNRGLLSVRPWSSRLRVVVPPGASRFKLLAPVSAISHPRRWVLTRDAGGQRVEFGWGQQVEVIPGEALWIHATAETAVEPGSISAPPWRLKPVLRRLACEARERLRPVFPRS